jgi:hypothetical protein
MPCFRASPAGLCKWTRSDRLRSCVRKMRLHSIPAARCIVIRLSLKTQTLSKYVPRMHLCGRAVWPLSSGRTFHRAYLAATLARCIFSAVLVLTVRRSSGSLCHANGDALSVERPPPTSTYELQGDAKRAMPSVAYGVYKQGRALGCPISSPPHKP